ncbi:hypothetical protein GMRT_13603 [Giardia muris]|uniref:Uncharacterized protein n=1 Tax=Giardia muris TaxID=5742 RepID=A0A4Z1T7G5_GIAMU|nr:hypothetical protein GMRT_13603 [Giardia muris]|eukprot:TNJ30023.1 hypothetical protein GMRT_13603 [Giardia muris]
MGSRAKALEGQVGALLSAYVSSLDAEDRISALETRLGRVSTEIGQKMEALTEILALSQDTIAQIADCNAELATLAEVADTELLSLADETTIFVAPVVNNVFHDALYQLLKYIIRSRTGNFLKQGLQEYSKILMSGTRPDTDLLCDDAPEQKRRLLQLGTRIVDKYFDAEGFILQAFIQYCTEISMALLEGRDVKMVRFPRIPDEKLKSRSYHPSSLLNPQMLPLLKQALGSALEAVENVRKRSNDTMIISSLQALASQLEESIKECHSTIVFLLYLVPDVFEGFLEFLEYVHSIVLPVLFNSQYQEPTDSNAVLARKLCQERVGITIQPVSTEFQYFLKEFDASRPSKVSAALSCIMEHEGKKGDGQPGSHEVALPTHMALAFTLAELDEGPYNYAPTREAPSQMLELIKRPVLINLTPEVLRDTGKAVGAYIALMEGLSASALLYIGGLLRLLRDYRSRSSLLTHICSVSDDFYKLLSERFYRLTGAVCGAVVEAVQQKVGGALRCLSIGMQMSILTQSYDCGTPKLSQVITTAIQDSITNRFRQRTVARRLSSLRESDFVFQLAQAGYLHTALERSLTLAPTDMLPYVSEALRHLATEFTAVYRMHERAITQDVVVAKMARARELISRCLLSGN